MSRKITLWSMLLLGMMAATFSCNEVTKQNAEEVAFEQKVFNTHMRSLCSTIENFNDLLKKSPDSLAWVGYGEIIREKIELFESACKEDVGMDGDLLSSFKEAKTFTLPFTSQPLEKKLDSQKKLMQMSRDWLQNYKL